MIPPNTSSRCEHAEKRSGASPSLAQDWSDARNEHREMVHELLPRSAVFLSVSFPVSVPSLQERCAAMYFCDGHLTLSMD
jgi:hypothetical protein